MLHCNTMNNSHCNFRLPSQDKDELTEVSDAIGLSSGDLLRLGVRSVLARRTELVAALAPAESLRHIWPR